MSDVHDISGQTYRDSVTDAEGALSVAQASGKSAKEIANLQQKVIEAKKALNEYNAEGANMTGTLEEQQQKAQDFGQKVQALEFQLKNAKNATKPDEDSINLIQSSLDLAKNDYEAARKVIEDRVSLDNEEKTTLTQNQKKFNEMSLANDIDYWQAKASLAQKGSKEWLDAQLKANQAAYNKAISQPDVNTAKAQADLIIANRQANDTYNKQSIKDREDDINARLALIEKGSQAELDLKLKLLEQEKQASILNAQGNAHEIERIIAESEKKKNDLILQSAQSSADKLLQLQEDNLKLMLSNAVDGSEDALYYSIGVNNSSAQKSIVDAIAAAAKDNPAITAQDVTLSSTFDLQQIS